MKKLVLLGIILLVAFTVGGCVLTGTVIFDNWSTNYAYECYLDGFYEGEVAVFGRLWVYGVSPGLHFLEADNNASLPDDPLAPYSEWFNVSFGDNYWRFN